MLNKNCSRITITVANAPRTPVDRASPFAFQLLLPIDEKGQAMRFVPTFLLAAIMPVVTVAHDGYHEPATQSARVQPQVSIRVEGDVRIIESNALPNHKAGRFPNGNNPNAIRAQQQRYTVPAEPQVASQPTQKFMQPFGVAVNGVVFDPGAAEFWRGNRQWQYEPLADKINLGLDDNHAHVQPTGAYHYHGMPTGLIETLGNPQEKMLLIGWAADGFPMYTPFAHEEADNPRSPLVAMKPSYRLKQGNRPSGNNGPGGRYDGTFVNDWQYVPGSGDLDECNGRVGVTPEYPDGTFYYVVTDDFPFIPRLYRGTPDRSFERSGPPGGGRGGPPGGPGGRRGPPPPGFGPPPGAPPRR